MLKKQKMQYFQKGWKITENVTRMEWNDSVNVDDDEMREYNLKKMYGNGNEELRFYMFIKEWQVN